VSAHENHGVKSLPTRGDGRILRTGFSEPGHSIKALQKHGQRKLDVRTSFCHPLVMAKLANNLGFSRVMIAKFKGFRILELNPVIFSQNSDLS